MKHSESIANIAPAMIAAQGELGAVSRDSSAMSDDGREYKYTTLGAMWAAVRPVLQKHGLMVIQGGDGVAVSGCLSMETTIVHASGEYISGTFVIPYEKSTPQSFGQACTYCRRYMLGCMLGIVSEEDTDGVEKPKRQPKKSQPAPSKSPEQPSPPAPDAGDSQIPAQQDTSESRLAKAVKAFKESQAKSKDPANTVEANGRIDKIVEYAGGLNATGKMTDLHFQQLKDLVAEHRRAVIE